MDANWSDHDMQQQFDAMLAKYRNKEYDVAIQGLEVILPFLENTANEFLQYNTFKLLFSIWYGRDGAWYESTKSYFNTLAKKYTAAAFPKLQLIIQQFLVQIERYKGKTALSEKMAVLLIAEFEKQQFTGYAYAEHLGGYGYNLILQERMAEAYAILEKAERLADQKGYLETRVKMLGWQANIDDRISAHYEGISKMLKVLKILKRTQSDPVTFVTTLFDLALTLSAIGKQVYALYFSERVLELAEKTGNSQTGCASCDRLFNEYLEIGRNAELKRVNNKFAEFLKNRSEERYEALFYRQKLVLCLLEKQFSEAAGWVEKIESRMSHLFVIYEIENVHLTLSEYYSNKKEFEKAAHHLKAFAELQMRKVSEEQKSRIRSHNVQSRLRNLHIEKENAENLARAKQDFLASMSHEIRSPMHAVVGFSRLLMNETLNESQRRKLHIIEHSAEHLMHIIDDVLDSSKIDAGKMELESLPFSLQDLVSEVTETVMLKAIEKQLDFNIKLDESLPAAVLGDPTRVKQVLLNLLFNAVKFTNKGKVSLSVERLGHRYAFRVSDTGIGIPPAAVNRIFEGYIQAGASVSRQYGGTGLGLKISRQLIELMGGKLNVKSEVGTGTIFQFELMLKETSYHTLIQEEKTTAFFLNGKKLLAADDNENNLLVIEKMLQLEAPDAEVQLARGGREAVAACALRDFDYVLLDLDMPDMNGFEVLQQIRKGNPTLPIIANSANVMITEQEAIAFGFSAFLLKPFNGEMLIAKLKAVTPEN